MTARSHRLVNLHSARLAGEGKDLAYPEEVLNHLGRGEHRDRQGKRDPEAAAEVVHHVRMVGVVVVMVFVSWHS
jgi:hypothetical protein